MMQASGPPFGSHPRPETILPAAISGPDSLLRRVLAIIDNAIFPVQLSRLRIERVNEVVGAGIDNVIAVNCDVAIDRRHREDLSHVFG